jgi:capsular polysaccharide biosynthesis protein
MSGAVQNLGDLLRRVPGLVQLKRWWGIRARARLRSWLASCVAAFVPRTSRRWGTPQKAIVLYELLQSGRVTGRVVTHGQTPSRLPADSMQVRCGLGQHSEQPWPILWTRHANAHLISSSLALELPEKKIALESIYGRKSLSPRAEHAQSAEERADLLLKALWSEPARSFFRLPAPVALKGPYTSIISRWTPTRGTPNFSHWFLDALPRLAVLPEFPADTKILVPAALAPYQVESLKMLGVRDRIRRTVEENLIVEDYWFSSPASMVVCDSPYSVDYLRKQFLPHASPSFVGPKKFIIDREGHFRAIANRKEFNRFFEQIGWKIIKTETLSLADEIKLFKDAEAICGMVGSGFTNAVWCSPGCKIIQILPETLLDGSTEWICMHNQLVWRFLVCPGDLRFNGQVNLQELASILRELELL